MIWKCGSKNIDCGTRVLLMGIVNVTPDSFSDGGEYADRDAAVRHALELVEQGADIIDIGAQSTRPGHSEVSPDDEWQRLEGVLTALRPLTDVPISVDTYHPDVARRSIALGADIINDVSGTVGADMARIIADSGCGWVLMHSGSGGCDDVAAFFADAVDRATSMGVRRSQLCLDMGIGFGKTVDQDAQLICGIAGYRLPDIPVLLGCSRKRVIGAIGGCDDARDRLCGNVAADTAAIIGGVNIIRLHDIKNEKQGISAAQELSKWIR